MMKKTTSALAIAALLGSGAATAATFQINDDTTFTLTGRVNPAYTSVEEAGTTTTTTYDVTSGTPDVVDTDDETTVVRYSDGVESESAFTDFSRLIIDAEHRLDNGLTGFVNYELRNLGNTSDDGISDTNVEARNAYIGMEGSEFGRLSFGRQATVYGSTINGYQDIGYYIGVSLPANSGEDRSLRYSTPSVNGLTFHAGARVNGDASEADNNDNSSSLAGAIVYEADAFTLQAVYDQAKDRNREDSTITTNAGDALVAEDDSEEAIFGLSAETNIAGVDAAVYYVVDGSQDEKDEITTTGLNVGYTVGALGVTGIIQTVDSEVETVALNNETVEDPGSNTEMMLQATYNLSDQFLLVGEYTQLDQEEDLGDGMALGAVYNF